ncbi:O-antigen ligase family protein [Muricauda oceani]|uniref:O-antigen ligase family protein n=1 Tax=Flagellimonas oceani TaxID=2698672 RepID=A0A6G7J6T3_9FLAO|nr:O-antigen ligase family protein [Allomuricauda oceani]MBW8242645.1 O-antigen ligase family protein [Allomuricauda oceani]QII46400.1 O-antigen ligase family protein [Allomuricauda oceani]
MTNGKIIANYSSVLSLFILLVFIASTGVNVLFGSAGTFKDQLIFTIVHLQLVLAFMLGNYFATKLSKDFVYKSLIIVLLLLSIRLFLDDFDKVFNLSTVRGLRVESQFAGGANNFALLLGIGFIIAFFYLNKGSKRLITCLYLLLVIVLTMSRGALFGVVFTLFLVAVYDQKGKTLVSLLRISFGLSILGVFLFFMSDGVQVIVEKFSDRFLSFFTGEVTFEQASSGRPIIFKDIYENHLLKANTFEVLFGHGMGSIDFEVNGYPYESSHNIFIDILFRNGAFALIGFIVLICYLTLSFLNNRKNEDLVFFGIFVFLHFEIMVNPFVYAAQTGWIYGLFLALFIRRNRLRKT